MKGYKAFERGMICRGKQYTENTVFEEGSAEICKSGMHFCEDPLDVLDYYPLVDRNGNIAEFAEVEALDEAKTFDCKKYCTRKLKIGAKISFPELVQASINSEVEAAAQNNKENHNKFDAKISSRTVSATIGSSRGSARIGSSGNHARICSSGYNARIKSIGKNSVICCAGHHCCASAKIGSWITLAEWGQDATGHYKPVCVKTEYVDGEMIKEDTLYKLENGEFVEAEQW